MDNQREPNPIEEPKEDEVIKREEPNDGQKKKKYTKGFYIAFACCLCAIGAAAWFTYGDVSNYMTPQTEIPTASQSEQQAEAKVGGVTQPATTSEVEFTTAAKEEPTEAATTAPSANVDAIANQGESTKLFFPVSETVERGYTGDTPVYFETLKDWRLHKAVDFKAIKGQNVMAVDNGIVSEIREDGLYGSTIVIEHNSKFVAQYSGVQPAESMSVGDYVSGGDVIGKITKVPCESKEPSHLHLEIKKDGESVNPLELLNKE